MKNLFLTCFLICNFYFVISGQTATIPPEGFVYTEGENFMLNGKPYYFSGTNVYDFFTYGSGSGDPETHFMDKERIDNHMHLLYKNGVRVVRLWGFSHEDWHGFEIEKGVYNEPQFMLFDYIVKSAEANGLKLIVALENYWNDYGGIKDRLKWEGIDVQGGGQHDQGQFFTNESAIQGYKDYVEYFITRINHYDNVEYRNDPTILAWELMNEPRYQGFGDDFTSNVLRAWVDDMGQFIKSIDPNHILGTGLEGHGVKYGFGGDEGNDFIKIHQSPYIDFSSAHPYIRESWSNFTVEETMALVCKWADESHDILNKPLYVGEFNVERNERLEWWEDIYGFVEEKKIGASAFWWFPDDQTPEDKFAVFEGDTELTIFAEHSLDMENMSGGEAIYVSLLSPKSGDQYIAGSTVQIESNLLNSGNTIAKVDFYSNNQLIGSDTTAPYKFQIENLIEGNYNIYANAVGVNGEQVRSSIRKINVDSQVLYVEYKNAVAPETINEIKPHFKLINNSSQDVDYKDLSIRYWFTQEGDTGMNYFSEFSKIGSSNVKGEFVNVNGNDYYMELTFDAAAGKLISQSNSGRIETKMAKKDWSPLDATDDYSFIASQIDFAKSDKITLYLKGQLIGGIEPLGNNTNTAPIANFTYDLGRCGGVSNFDASSSTDADGDTLTYEWIFSDGTIATGVVPMANYFSESTSNTGTVTLTVSDGKETNTITREITGIFLTPCAKPVQSVDIFADETRGEAPLTVSFSALVSGAFGVDEYDYLWDLDNENETSTEREVSYTYTNPGIYTVSVEVTAENDSETGFITITVTEPIVSNPNTAPIANFTFDTGRCGGPNVNLDASSSTDADGDSLTYEWDFGNGETASGIRTSYQYDGNLDTAIITLTVSDGKVTSVKTSEVGLLPFPCAKPVNSVLASANVVSGKVPLTISFSAVADGAFGIEEYDYLWNFDDGNAASTTREVSYTYTKSGVYNVSVQATAEGDSESGFITITVEEDEDTVCDFGAPSETPLSSIYGFYTQAIVLGNNGPNLGNLNGFSFNWDAVNQGVNHIAIQTNNGIPAYYINLSDKISHTLESAEPSITFLDTGIDNFDGTYYVVKIEDDIALVSINDDFTIYFSKTNTAPDCVNFEAKKIVENQIIEVYPNPVNSSISAKVIVNNIQGLTQSTMSLYDITGKLVLEKNVANGALSTTLDVSSVAKGLYLIHVVSRATTSVHKILIE